VTVAVILGKGRASGDAMSLSPEVVAALVAAVVAILTSFLSAGYASRLQGAKIASEVQNQTARLSGELQNKLQSDLRTEFMAESAIQQLLSVEKWNRRSLEQISMHIGGFDGDGLRRLLVRSGAVRFTISDDPGKEMWGLRIRNQEYLNVEERKSASRADSCDQVGGR
jgi:hypothetical protein